MHEGTIRARDGRTIAYGEFGDPAGFPAVLCHGSAESRLFEVDVGWTAAQGLRVISPDRPGFGGSDPITDRTVLSWADDAEDLANALALDEFSVIGWSGGGPHALATAYALGSRVSAVSLVGSFAPFKLVPGAYEAMAPNLRVLADIAPDDPRGTAELVAEFAKPWVEDPETFGLGGETNPDDEAVQQHPEWGPNLRAQIREGLRRADGIAWDAAALYGKWGFAAEAVTQPADVWHGTGDRVTPFLNGEWLARTMPEATLHPIDGGHFILYSDWQDIASALLERRSHFTR